MYITSDSYIPVAAISRDGQIYILDSRLTLSARQEGDFLVVNMISDSKEVTTVKYMIKFFYTVHE